MLYIAGYEGVVCDRKNDTCTNKVCQHGGQCFVDVLGDPFCVCMVSKQDTLCENLTSKYNQSFLHFPELFGIMFLIKQNMI